MIFAHAKFSLGKPTLHIHKKILGHHVYIYWTINNKTFLNVTISIICIYDTIKVHAMRISSLLKPIGEIRIHKNTGILCPEVTIY